MRQTLFNCALIIASALCIAGCVEHIEHKDIEQAQLNVKYFIKTISTHIFSIEIEGHKYIIFNGGYKGNIIHSESCPCKKENKEVKNHRLHEEVEDV